MAEPTNTTTTSTTGPSTPKRASAQRSTTRKPATARKRTSSTRSTRAKTTSAPSKSTVKRNRTIAANETSEAAEAQVRAAKSTADYGRGIAERAALVSVGATLEARDRAVALVSDIRDLATKPEVSISKFERRGTTARKHAQRDVKKARTRLERELKGRRRDAEKLVKSNRTRVEREVGHVFGTAKERVSAIA